MTTANPMDLFQTRDARASEPSATAPPRWRRKRRARGFFGFALLTSAFIATLLSRPWVAEGVTHDVVVNGVAWPLFLAGVLMRWWSAIYINDRKSKQLVTAGPYSLCRNPLYLGSFLIALSVAVFLTSILFAVACLLVAIIYARHVVPDEERRLRENFGREFEEYVREVPRFLPAAARYRAPRCVEVMPAGLTRELRRSLPLFVLPFLMELLTILRSQPWWPHLVQLP